MRILSELLEFFDAKFSPELEAEINAIPPKTMEAITGITDWEILKRFYDVLIDLAANSSGIFKDWKDVVQRLAWDYDIDYVDGKLNTQQILKKIFGIEGEVK
jgi:hypothetical protein